ncbi:TlpA family protein disulfide reductase [Streptosporangium sp. NPDC004379]|uniref:TlpA family protein disulfide reductase n=1 Tax=Streptosporangium sp. NPDC004379 TaxID=3366189 RepID=UPI0036A9AAC3
MRAKLFSAAALCAAVAVSASGCAGNQGSQPQAGDTRFVAGDGKITVFDAASRKAAPEVAGETLDGGRTTLAEHRGKVVVLNFWASWCAPCRAEAPTLKDIAARTKDSGVEFVGIDFKDRKADALAFERGQQPGYPSIFDQPGKIALSFQGTVPPAAIPSTLVIDRQGRIAARALGAVKHSELLATVTKLSAESR